MLMNEPIIETPFIASDMIAPGSLENESEIYNNIIPIRTWSRGKTLNDMNNFADDSFTDLSSVIGSTLITYFPSNDIDMNCEVVEETNINNEIGMNTLSYRDDFDADDFDENSIPEEFNDKNNKSFSAIVVDESMMYDDDFEPSHNMSTVNSPIKKSRLALSLADYSAIQDDNVDKNSLANYLGLDHEVDNELNLDTLKTSIPTHGSMRSPVLSPDLNNRIANELIQIMRDYDEAINGIESNHKSKRLNKENINNINDDFPNEEKIRYNDDSIRNKSNGETFNENQQLTNNLKHPKNNFKKSSLYIPQSRNIKATEIKQQEPNFVAHAKHKEFINYIANKRKNEEESNLIELQKNEIRRKKFKETLLEKAMKARNQSDGTATLGFLATTKAFENNKKKINNNDITTPNETDEEKRERIALIRRKFKEKHKMILESLMKKNKENEFKIEQDQQLIEKQKEKYRKKLLKILSQDRIEAIEAGDHESIVQCDDTIAAVEGIKNNDFVDDTIDAGTHETANNNLTSYSSDYNKTAIKKSNKDNNSKIPVFNRSKVATITDNTSYDSDRRESSAPIEKTKDMPITPPRAAGSALAAVRSNRNGPNVLDTLIEKQISESSKVYSKKMKDYLNTLMENKKNEMEKKKKLNDRLVRRAAILSNRLMKESNERKLMELEDKDNKMIGVGEDLISNSTNTKIRAPEKKRTNKIINNDLNAVNVSSDEIKSSKTKIIDDNNNNSTVKLTDEAVDALVNRLNQPIKGDTSTIVTASGVNISTATIYRDYNDWKKKNNVPADCPVFCMTGWYPCVKEALLSRGWIYNSDSSSPYFDLKWSLRSIDISQENLQPWQLTNHFLKNIAITTKIGLLKSLQSLSWLVDSNCNDIIPRGYDLTNHDGIIDFIDDFKYQKVINILKKLYYDITGNTALIKNKEELIDYPENDNINKESNEINKLDNITDRNLNDDRINKYIIDLNTFKINIILFNTCCNVLERLLLPYDSNNIDQTSNKQKTIQSSITSNEWEIINCLSMYNTNIDNNEDNSTLSSNLSNYILNYKEEILQIIQLVHINRLIKILQDIDLYIDSSQGPINGYNNNCHNLWIVKPAAKSRGRGIQTFNNLSKLLKYCDINTTNYSCGTTQWIVQKYIENPLVICNRKFDLRQWVLVTDWNPLTIYFYQECYVRMSVDEYSTDEQVLSNSFIHLVNNSIGKNSENFSKVLTSEYGHTIEGYMLSFQDFEDYMIKHSNKNNVVKNKIHPRMKEIVTWSLMCASEMIEHRKNSWELYGFDFMIDDNYNTWLIEINSSPACDYSTKVTERYVKLALVELLGVVIDQRKYDQLSKQQKQLTEKPDYGGWINIYKGPLIEKPIGTYGLDISLKGEGIKKYNKSNKVNNNGVNNFGTTDQHISTGQVVKNKNNLSSNILKSLSNSNIDLKSNIMDNDSVGSDEINDTFDDQAIKFERPKTYPNRKNVTIIENSNIGNDISDDLNDSDEEDNRYAELEGNRVNNISGNTSSKTESQSHNINLSSKYANTKAIPLKVFSVEF